MSLEDFLVHFSIGHTLHLQWHDKNVDLVHFSIGAFNFDIEWIEGARGRRLHSIQRTGTWLINLTLCPPLRCQANLALCFIPVCLLVRLNEQNTLCPKNVVHQTHGDNFVNS